MCGITGFITKDRGRDVPGREELLGRMCGSIRYRGPDEQGTMVRGRAALGMRRLSIIDVKSGQQPIYSEDGSLVIVFNGEIYNFLDIKKELESRGHRFRTNSDTEVIVHAYQQFGSECLNLLRGMFAFAIWDFRTEELFLARDRVGKKPLYYGSSEDGQFIFGSELKTLLVHGGIKRDVDLAALDAYITFGYVPEDFCIFKNIHKLEPGSFLIVKDGRIRTKYYWDFKYEEAPISSEAELTKILSEKVRDAVKARMISEVPIGAFLSGGVDSASIVAMMSELSATPVKTFSIGFNEEKFDELKYARIASRQFATEHHEFIVTPELINVVNELVLHFDEPFSDPSALPMFILAKMARPYVTVVLSGDGGDELFGGYTRYSTHERRNAFALLPKFFRYSMLQPFSYSLPHGTIGKNYLHNISLDFVERYIDSVSHFNNPQKLKLYSYDFKSKLNHSFGEGERNFREIADAICPRNPTDRLLYLDSKTYLPGDILTKVDRMTMANSIEARSPLLDHQLIEFVLSIPIELKIRGKDSKYIFKKAMEGKVPNEILHRRKQGFAVPIEVWINEQLRDKIRSDLTASRTLERGLFERSYIQTLLREHSNSRRDHSYRLWLLWMLELWYRKFVDFDSFGIDQSIH